jgi:hypothetical protein
VTKNCHDKPHLFAEAKQSGAVGKKAWRAEALDSACCNDVAANQLDSEMHNF